MSAITMIIESVRTRGNGEVLLTLSVQPEFASQISGFLPRIGEQIGVAFADVSGKPVVPDKQPDRGWDKLAPLTQTAVKFCKDEDFQKFVVEKNGHSSELPTEAGASEYIKKRCGVKSRKELETVDGARERFGALMAEYREWLHKRR